MARRKDSRYAHVTSRLTDEEYEALHLRCAVEGLLPSQMIRAAIRHYLLADGWLPPDDFKPKKDDV
jgi:hypothetical protein